MITENDIYKIYRRVWNRGFEILKGKLTDDEAQQAKRGIGARKEDFLMWALRDVDEFRRNPEIKRLQIKVECDNAHNTCSYLIYLNFI